MEAIIFLFFYFLVVNLLPYILGIVISVIAICLIRKKIAGKDKKFRIVVYIIVIIVCVGISVKLEPLWCEYASAIPDSTYVEMKRINDNKSLIGLSKEQVVELLGEPISSYTAKYSDYYYDAGEITNYITGGNRKSYVFQVCFDENDIVRSTSIAENV